MLRYAPSPTKDMDISSLRVALLNFIVSKQLNEELLIRIDDTNKDKNIEGMDKKILEILNLFSIDHSRVVYASENIKYHTGMAMKLLLDKKAFNCFCSDEALEQDKQKAKKQNKPYSYSGFCETISDETKFHCNAPFVVRIKKPSNDITFKDTLKGNMTHTPSQVDSFVILNHNKTPTYNFACGVDDMLNNISTVIRDKKFLQNSSQQLHVMHALGYEKDINYIHIPAVDGADFSVQELIDMGYLPAAIANYIISLGYETPKQIFTIEEAISWFDISKLFASPVKFDIKKLNHLNIEYLNDIDNMRLSKILGYADDDIGKLAKLYIKKCVTIKKLKGKIKEIFSKKQSTKGFENEFDIVKNSLEKAPFFEKFDKLLEYLKNDTKLQNDKLLKQLSYIFTGSVDEEENLTTIYPLIKNYLGEMI